VKIFAISDRTGYSNYYLRRDDGTDEKICDGSSDKYEKAAIQHAIEKTARLIAEAARLQIEIDLPFAG